MDKCDTVTVLDVTTLDVTVTFFWQLHVTDTFLIMETVTITTFYVTVTDATIFSFLCQKFARNGLFVQLQLTKYKTAVYLKDLFGNFVPGHVSFNTPGELGYRLLNQALTQVRSIPAYFYDYCML